MPTDDGLTARSPEAEVILRAARRNVDAADVDVLGRLLGDELDWAWIADTAERHGTTALVHRTVAERFADRVPAAVLAQLGSASHLQGLRNQVLAESLGNLVPSFGAEGIRVLAFKGPVLAVGVYGDLRLRAFGDLDLLVHRRDYRRAGHLLERLGYPLTRSWRWEAAFQRDLTVIDLHRAMTSPRFRVHAPFDRQWDTRQTVCVAGAAVPALSNEHLLMALCVQVAKDAWEDRVRLEKVCDVAELVRMAADLDWDAALRDAERAGALGMMAFGLAVATRLLDAPVPEGVRRRLDRLAGATAQARVTAATVFDPRSASGRPSTELVRFHGRLRERRRDRIRPYVDPGHHWLRLVAVLTPNDEDRASVSLPAGLGAAYYVVRPVRLLARGVRAARGFSGNRRPRAR